MQLSVCSLNEHSKARTDFWVEFSQQKYTVEWNGILKFMFDFCSMIIKVLFFFAKTLWGLYQFSREPLLFLWYSNWSFQSLHGIIVLLFFSSAGNCSNAPQYIPKPFAHEASSSSASLSQTLWNPASFLYNIKNWEALQSLSIVFLGYWSPVNQGKVEQQKCW